ncbi:MAG: type II secretion system protein [Candidatus Pacebacteria bacterium]|nr:type II secretion system protein [Candidatus Paceibacterota bacterium]
MNTKQLKRGFTLVELVVVLGILAILATVTLLVLNPAQMFAQARDSQRVSDLSTLNSAISLYLSTATTTQMYGSTGSCSNCFNYGNTQAANCLGRHSGTSQGINSRAVDQSGWIGVNFNMATGGAPISALPTDPSSSGNLFYSYACDNTNKTFELDADMESTRYASSGANDKESTDGGSSSSVYEVGNDPGLDL